MRRTQDAKTFLASLEDESVGLIITDPPWKLAGGGKFLLAASYPLLSVADVAEILADGLRVLKPGGHLYTYAPCGVEFWEVGDEFRAKGWRPARGPLASDKSIHRGLGAYRNGFDPVLVWSKGASRGFPGPPCKHSSLLRGKSVNVRTAKSIENYRTFIEMSSEPGELIVDPFCGSNPLESACRFFPDRRWEAADILTPEQVSEDVARRQLPDKRGLWNPVGQRGLEVGA
jgi:DNA modification methylase